MSTKQDIQQQKLPQKKHRSLRRLGRVLLGVFIVFIILVLFIRSSWGQSIIKDRLVSYISDKTNTKVEIERLFITFGGNVQVDGLFLEDKVGDTLVYSKTLEANLAIWDMAMGKTQTIDAIDVNGLTANVKQKDTIFGFNYQFLIDALAPPTATPTPVDTTTSVEPTIIKEFHFKNINIAFRDIVSGINSHFIFDKLEGDNISMEMETMRFSVEALEMADANIKLIQTPVPNNPETEETPLPTLIAAALTLKNVKLDYQSKADELTMDAYFSELYTEIPKFSIQEKNLNINQLDLKDSKINIHTKTKANTTANNTDKTSDAVPKIEWPAYQMDFKNLNLENNAFRFYLDNQTVKKDLFNPNAIVLNNLNLQIESVFLKDKTARAKIEEFQFNEASGYQLREFNFNADITDTNLKINQIKIGLNRNNIKGQINLNYPKLSSLIQAPEKTKIHLNLQDFKMFLEDLYPFQPQLKNNTSFVALSKKPLHGNITASGYLSKIEAPKINLFWGNTTHISAKGNIQNMTQPENIQFDIPNFSAETKRKDLIIFLEGQQDAIELPENINLSGQIAGNLSSMKTDLKLNTSQGTAKINGAFASGNIMVFDASVAITNYQVNALLKNPKLGNLTASINANGKGQNINTLDAKVEAKIDSFQLNNYNIKNLNLNGKIQNGRGRMASKYKDNNLNLNLDAFVVLDSITPEVTVEMDVIGADLQGLGFSNRNIKTGLKLYADFYGNLKDYNIAAIIKDGVFVYDNKTYLLGNLDAQAHVRTDTTSVAINNKILDLRLESNTDPITFSGALQRHVFSYFYRNSKVPDSIVKPVNLTLEGHISQSTLINEVFLVNLKDIDTVDIAVVFNERKRLLNADITAPHINYNDLEVDSLAFTMTTDNDKFLFNFGFNQIKAGPLLLPKSEIKGEQINNEMSLDFLAYHKEEDLMNIQAKITGHSDRLRFHVLPQNLTLNKQVWNIPDNNEVIITENNLVFNDFNINKNTQSIGITDKNPSIKKDHIAIDFNNFKISEFFDYFNPDKKLAVGHLNGNLILQEPLTNTGVIADLSISDLALMDVNMGTLTLDGSTVGVDTYDIKFATKGGAVDMDVMGKYLAKNETANLNLDVVINEFKMKALNGFTRGAVVDTDGSFTGQFKIKGTTAKPIYNGVLNFNNADFKIAKFNSAFTLKNETLAIDNDGISMRDFTILDENKNSFLMSGDMGTKTFLNPTFNLNMKAKNFQLLNAKKEDNDFIYGKATFNVDAKITGDLQIPIIRMDLDVKPKTDITYVMPSATVNIEERDGVVIFVNRENPDAILTRNESQTATVKGFDIKAKLNVQDDATATIVIDENTGDNFKVSGSGELNFRMKPNGNMNLVGAYDVFDGHYEMNLYNLVNRRFDIAKGSRVTWSGNPFDAKLDVKAIYKLETSASALMSSASSNINVSEQGKYRQILPFFVYLNIDGELMAPKISFNLDMPEDEQGSIGGQVFGRVQQINQQEDELNRQVFSLLVLNRFYPDAGSDGSNGGVATIARDNLNDALSDQLNVVSDKIFGKTGFEVDFGVDSFTDYQGDSPQERTQLDIAAQKKLLNDRLIVRVGSEVDIQGGSTSNETSPLIGNVSLEYLITENGRYRLKGFRKNEFENVIDGQTIVTGIGLIFNQEFNKFSELWDAMFRPTEEEIEKKPDTNVEEKPEIKNQDVNKSMEQKSN